ncbi:MAG: DHH family phosphoesterase [Oscillospiraceae bacterium]|nr:DHH family phosphoesterase [Oscillospiraceae bacterium]
MFRESRMFTPVIAVLMILCAVLTCISFFFDYTLFLISAASSFTAFTVVLVLMRRLNKKSAGILREIAGGIQYTGENGFMDAPMPVICIYGGSEVIWYNKICADSVFAGIDMRGEAVSDVLPQINIKESSPPEGYPITFQEKEYTAYVSAAGRDGTAIAVIYLIDDSSLKHFAREYRLSRPTVAIITVDNYDEMVQNFKETERAQLIYEIENEVEKYFSRHSGFVSRIERDKFLAVVEERGVQSIIEAKFDILDKVRGIRTGGHMSATLSIGVGHDAPSMYESELLAKQALDMCLGRGGDQAAVKNANGYEFFGGMSKGIERRTKVKTRIIANALGELIESSGGVVIMGHRFYDLDCLGAAVGMLKAVQSMGKPATVCINKEKNLVGPLLARLEAAGQEQDFLEPRRVTELIGPDTLLIVVDTHVPHMLESQDVFKACKNVAVIDHHRKLVSYIDNAVIFYHEPYASSSSEMVAELLQYFPSQPRLTKLEAEALLSGIMLDTKNFVLRTGVRTFEAAAYLRRIGADTVEVRKLFANSMEVYQQKAKLVANAQIYKGCAVASSEYTFEGIMTTAPQAADELMTITGVDASFVIFTGNGAVNVSARSMGEINVQLIMEKLGGGGHLTMAAAQFPGETAGRVKERLIQAIDGYYSSLAPRTPDGAAEEHIESERA